MTKINKNDIIDMVSEDAYLSRRDAKEAVDATFKIIKDALKAGDEVNISNFGVFKPYQRKERVGTDPSNHNKVKLKSKKSVSLHLSKIFKEEL